MNWISRILAGTGDAQALEPGLAESLASWQSHPEPAQDRAHFETRYVVLNTEASGLVLNRDHLLAVAAIAIDGSLIAPRDCYHAPLAPSPNLALTKLLTFIGKSPLVTFNAALNLGMLVPELDNRLGIELELPVVDLYFLLPALFPERHDQPVRLADWMNSFGVETFQRHHALGDAWAIAQLFLAVQARALSLSMTSMRALIEHERQYRQYRRKV
jgi:DNA polymerase-3 subunit epsilon